MQLPISKSSSHSVLDRDVATCNNTVEREMRKYERQFCLNMMRNRAALSHVRI